MDADVREQFKLIHESLRENREEQRVIATQLAQALAGWAECRISCNSGIAEATSSAKAAHHRITEGQDRAKERRGHGAALWIGVVLAVVSAAGAAIVSLFSGRRL